LFLVGPSLLAPSFWSALSAAKVDFPAAMLVPKSGEHAALGRSMERAAWLAQGGDLAQGGKLAKGAGDVKQLHVFDTLGTPEGAIAAARVARHNGARILLGPIFARELPGVIGVAGAGVPVISFSNDAALRESGAFVFGITANQIVTALLRYGAGRGVRRVALAPGAADAWSKQVAAAAVEAARPLGVEVVGMASDSTLPHAVLVTDSAQLADIGPGLTQKGVQVLAAIAGLDLPPETLRALEGTWFAAPDPARFASFSRTFEDQIGTPPGLIAGLAYDAVRIVQQLRLGGGIDRSALLAATGFKGVCGNVRFREDGSAARSLAILAVKDGNLANVAPPLG
jgi:ABC-type branched-subunit amino acid transport system substrate-binding protein